MECNHRIFRAELQLVSIVDDLPPVFDSFLSDEQARTCDNCRAVHPGKQWPEHLRPETRPATPA
jgi:3-hydroxyanthranilate 3,4-dioxygenase